MGLRETLRVAGQHALAIGHREDDDPETVRQRHMMLVIHYVMMTIGPLPNILLYLFCGLKWPAFVLFMTCSVPSWISFGLYVWLIRSLNLSIWIITSMPLYAPVLITLFAGGIRNSGYITHYVLVSPLICFCLHRRVGPCLFMFLLALLGLVVLSYFESDLYQWIVVDLSLTSNLPDGVRKWFWVANILELELLNMCFFGFSFNEIAGYLTHQDHLLGQMTSLSHKLATLDIDDVVVPTSDASSLEHALFDVVVKVREWKPYLPATLFLSDDGRASVDPSGRESSLSFYESGTWNHSPLRKHRGESSAMLKGKTLSKNIMMPTNMSLQALAVEMTDHHASPSDESLPASNPLSPETRPSNVSVLRVSTDTVEPFHILGPSADTVVPVVGGRGSVSVSLDSQKRGSRSLFPSPVDDPTHSHPHPRKRSVFHDAMRSLQRRTMTYAILQIDSAFSQEDSVQQIQMTMSRLFSEVARHVQKEKGAVHQFHGDRIVCVWHSANQQLRACDAVVELSKVLGQNDDVISALSAAAASGSMLIGTVGDTQRAPVVCGILQSVTEHLLELAKLISASFLVEAKIAKEIEHQFELAPVEVVRIPGWHRIRTDRSCAMSGDKSQANEPMEGGDEQTIFEVFSKTVDGEGCGQNGIEWMYSLPCSFRREKPNQFSVLYNTAFQHYVHGRLEDAHAILSQFLSKDDVIATSPQPDTDLVTAASAATSATCSTIISSYGSSPPIVPTQSAQLGHSSSSSCRSNSPRQRTRSSVPSLQFSLREKHIRRLYQIINHRLKNNKSSTLEWRPVRKAIPPWEILT